MEKRERKFGRAAKVRWSKKDESSEARTGRARVSVFHELQKYVNKWVAVLAYGMGHEIVVASGDTIVEARKEAESNGYHDVTFFKVPSGERVFVPTLNESGI